MIKEEQQEARKAKTEEKQKEKEEEERKKELAAPKVMEPSGICENNNIFNQSIS